MTIKPYCPSCKKPLPPGSPQGLCQECLLKAGLPTGAEQKDSGEKPGFVPPSVEELAPKFPQLEIFELIGRGGMGAVYKARQKELDRIVALKILPPGIGSDPSFAERFALEARALAKLNHPGIVTVYDSGRANGLYYFLMEFVDGVALRQLMTNSRVSPREALAIVPQICDALQFAHDHGIVHRDIKPENVMLDRLGRVKVADFGLAKLVQSVGAGQVGVANESEAGLTKSGKVLGTPNYMAPEQIEHPEAVDHRADIYALGVVFYQMLTGELPAQSLQPPSKLVQVDVRLDEVVLRALEKEPARRYSQASALKTELETITRPGPTIGVSPPASTRIKAENRTMAQLFLTIGWHILLLLFFFFFFLYVIPRFKAGFEGWNVALPSATRVILNVSSLMQSSGLVLIPLLLFADIGLCVFLWSPGRHRVLHLWSIGLVTAVGVSVLVAALSLAQALRERPADLSNNPQRSYVVQQLSSDISRKLADVGVNFATSLVTLSDDLSQAKVSMEGGTRRRLGGHVEPITNAAIEIRYLGEGRFFSFGTGQLKGVHFQSETGQWMSNGPARVPPPPASKRFDDLGLPYPELKVVLPWNDQTWVFPNPLALMEEMEKTKNYQAWSGIQTTNVSGHSYIYALSVNVPKPGERQKADDFGGGLALLRPDGTLLAAVTQLDKGIDSLHAATRVYDATGHRALAQLNLARATTNSPFLLSEVRWDPGTNHERIWTVNRFGVVFNESLVQDGQEKSAHELEEFAEKAYEPARWNVGVWTDVNHSDDFARPKTLTLLD